MKTLITNSARNLENSTQIFKKMGSKFINLLL